MKKILSGLVFALLLSCGGDNKNKPSKTERSLEENAEVFQASGTIQSPFESFGLNPQTFSIKGAMRDKQIDLPSGGKIFIPGGSVTDPTGNAVSEYEIKFREIQTPAEIIASGIPMV